MTEAPGARRTGIAFRRVASGACVAVAIAACSAKREPPAGDDRRPSAPTAPGPSAPAADPPRPTAAGQARTVRWSHVTRTEDCFFFSGPDGRDDQVRGDVVVDMVEREGERLVLRIGTATFEGTYVGGELSLVRKSRYDYNGPWQTTETIRGRLVDGQIVAAYAYEECELAAKACPGRCTVRGTLTFATGL